jgi:glycerol-3-phosphate O-acyltransferase
MDRPLVPYEPNALLAWVYGRVFESIEVDEAWAREVREAELRGTVVYVLRNLSFVDFFALDYLTKKYGLPRIRFANDLGLWVLEPMHGGWMRALRRRTSREDVADLRRAVTTGGSAALFLKRPPHLLEGRARGKIEGDHLVQALFDMQRKQSREILLVPQVFVWSRSPGTRGSSIADTLLGPSEWPGSVRSMAQFVGSGRYATLRAGEPVSLREFLAREQDGVSDEVLVRRLTYTLLRRLERERRAMLGPVKKPADRLREEVVRSPKLQKIIVDMAGEGLAERAVITQRALGMVREMEAALDMNAVSALARVFEQATSRMFSAIEVDVAGIERLREHAKEGTLVLLPSHKSHMDYLVLAWVLYQHKLQLPLIAAGDNLNFFPMGPLFRRAGAFFIRRTFAGDRLYAAVVDAYVRRLIKDGMSLEFFLEGGRSRTGKLLPPKLGLLSIVVDAALGVPTRTTWFCPVSIGYERFVEEKAFVHELTGGEKTKEDVAGLVKSIEVMVGRYGRLSVQFGKPMTMTDVLREIDSDGTSAASPRRGQHQKGADLQALTPPKRRAMITRLAYRVMNEINAVTAVTPGSLVATALLAHDRRGLPQGDLIARCEKLARTLRRSGARFSPSLLDPDGHLRVEALREAADLFVRAGHVEAHALSDDGMSGAEAWRQDLGEVIYVVPPEARMSLDLAKNVIIHFFAARALISTAILARRPDAGGAPFDKAWVDTVRERVLALSRLFKYEFTFRADAPFETIFDEEVAAMESDGELAPGAMMPMGEEGREAVRLYARLLENFVEGYQVAARGLAALLRGPVTQRDLVKRAIPAGERMFLAGEISRREAVSRPMLDNAYASFVDQGYLARREGKLALTESYATQSAVRTIEARIAAMGAGV